MYNPQYIYFTLYFTIMQGMVERFLQDQDMPPRALYSHWKRARKMCVIHNKIYGAVKIKTLHTGWFLSINLQRLSFFKKEFEYVFDSKERFEYEKKKWETLTDDLISIPLTENLHTFIENLEFYKKEFPRKAVLIDEIIEYQQQKINSFNHF